MHAGQFIAKSERTPPSENDLMFKTSVNPFSVDLFGDKVELGAEEGSEEDNLTAFTCDKGLLLKPDMSTLR